MSIFDAGHPKNWYALHVAGSVELLRVYIDDLEVQIDQGVSRFRRDARTQPIEDEPPRLLTIHRGLDSESWDLNAVFQDFFPELQRRSAVILLSAFFERELNALCAQLQTRDGSLLSLRDIAGTGAERATTYLRKVSRLDLPTNDKKWMDVKDIQALRNSLVHANGRLPNASEPDRGGLRQYVANCMFLTGENEVEIS